MGRPWIGFVLAWLLTGPRHDLNPSRPLTDRGLRNLVAYTRLLGYVRHFYPGPAAVRTDWDSFAVHGIPEIEASHDSRDLARKLQLLFHPIAPTVLVFPSPAPPHPPVSTASPEMRKVISWRHYGYGNGDPDSLYHSDLDVRSAPNGKPPIDVPDPRKPYEADLGGGVSCRVPLSLYIGSRAALSRLSTSHENGRTVERSVGLKGLGRSTRLADVALAWNIFQHFYPYFDVVRADWKTILSRSLQSAAVSDSDTAFLHTLQSMVAALQDGHGRVLGPSDDACRPPILWRWIEGCLVVVRVDAAVNDLVKPGDVVEKIDGRSVTDLLDAAERRVSGATVGWVRWRAVQELALGPPDSSVTLTLRREATAPFDVSLSRTLLQAEVIQGRSLTEIRPENYSEVAPGILYLDLATVDRADLDREMPRLEQAQKIVCDLRGYPTADALGFLRHLTAKPLNSANWNVPIITYPDRKRVRFDTLRWTLPPVAPYLKARMVFLTDERAISYAETYLGIVRHYRLGEIIGGVTAGTNGNINHFTLPGGYTIVWTGMKVTNQDGSRYHGIGIAPTIPVAPTIRGIAQGRDEVLSRALEDDANPSRVQ